MITRSRLNRRELRKRRKRLERLYSVNSATFQLYQPKRVSVRLSNAVETGR